MNWLTNSLPNWLVDSTGKIRLGNWAKDAVDWLTTNADWFFNWLATVLSAVRTAGAEPLRTDRQRHDARLLAETISLDIRLLRNRSVADL